MRAISLELVVATVSQATGVRVWLVRLGQMTCVTRLCTVLVLAINLPLAHDQIPYLQLFLLLVQTRSMSLENLIVPLPSI